jgi:dihydroorotate dehydrogenase
VHGFIASNTAADREGLQTPSDELEAIGDGGLSGPPLSNRGTCLVRYLYRATDGEIPIIGVGGVHDAESAYAKIRAGASLVQLYTALVYEGPGLIKRIKEGLVQRLREDDHVSIADAVGAAT